MRCTRVLVVSALGGIRARPEDGDVLHIYKRTFFSCYQEINLSIWGNQNELQILEHLYGFADIENYLPILEIISRHGEILDKCILTSLVPFTAMVLTFDPSMDK